MRVAPISMAAQYREGIDEATVGVKRAVDDIVRQEDGNGAGCGDVLPGDFRAAEDPEMHVSELREDDAELGARGAALAHAPDQIFQRGSVDDPIGQAGRDRQRIFPRWSRELHRCTSSVPLQPQAMSHPLSEPTEAPTTMSG